MPKGFAGMMLTPEGKARQRQLAVQGGKKAHAKGTAHEWSPQEAKEAGRKGGLKGKGKRRAKLAKASASYHPGNPLAEGFPFDRAEKMDPMVEDIIEELEEDR